MPRPERCGVLCSMGTSRKQIAFDLSYEALKQHYPRREAGQDPQFFKRAYKDIQRFMALADTEPLVTPSTWRFSTWMAGSAFTI